MGDLTKNFSRSEFACRGKYCCGQSAPIARDLVYALQRFRDEVSALRAEDTAIRPTSGFRCRAYNATIAGSSPASQHCLGLAVDVPEVGGLDAETLREIAERIEVFRNGGIGMYPWGVHLDVRGERVRWDYR